mmetsp:Transcript_29324/g.44168  ORF Transcript_29324/g.44168 Transcript_29324/m.44168 type:complete len:123 (-) Transcript_29324:3385-3753(-)
MNPLLMTSHDEVFTNDPWVSAVVCSVACSAESFSSGLDEALNLLLSELPRSEVHSWRKVGLLPEVGILNIAAELPPIHGDPVPHAWSPQDAKGFRRLVIKTSVVDDGWLRVISELKFLGKLG